MKKLKNDILRTTTYMALGFAVISGYMTEADAIMRGTVLIASLTWLAAFVYANTRKEGGKRVSHR